MRKTMAFFVFFCLGLVPTTARPQAAFTQGLVLNRQLKPAETQSYSVFLATGDYLAVRIAEQGVDLELRVVGPGGSLLSSERTVQGSNDTSDFRLIAPSSGEFRIEFVGMSKAAGSYELRVEAIRPATESDRNDTNAHDAWQQAMKLEGAGTPQGRRGAIEELEKVIGFRQANGDKKAEGETRAAIGRLYFYLDDRAKAVEYLQQSLDLFRSLNDSASEAIVLTNLGGVYQDMGEPLKAIEHFTQSLPVIRASGDKYKEAATVHNLGWSYQSLGDFRRASEMYREALPLWQASGNTIGEAQTVNNLGEIYSQLGEPQRSIEYFETALKLRRELKDGRGEAQTLGNLAALWAQRQDAEKAHDLFRQSLEVARRMEDKSSQSRALLGLSYVRSAQELGQAFAYVNESLELARALNDRRAEAHSLRRLGDLYRSSGDMTQSAGRYGQALVLEKAAGDAVSEAETLFSLAALLRDEGRLDEARSRAEEGLAVIESLRGHVAEPDLRTSFFASVQSYYGMYVDVLMRLHEREPSRGFDMAALQASERARARGLLDALAEHQADIREGIEPALLERERQLQMTLNVKDQQWRNLLAARQGEQKVAEARRQLDGVLQEFSQLQGEIRSRSPRYAVLTQPEVISLQALQGRLDENTVLLEYWLGADRSFLWAVTPNSVRSFVLPPANTIEQTARDYFAALTKPPVSQAVQSRAAGNAAAAQADILRLATELSETLVAPAAPLLETKRLVVVSHGALQYLPFAALPAPRELHKPPASILIDDHEIVTLPSASVLTALGAGAARDRDPRKVVAILADPVFSADDVRLAQRQRAGALGNQTLLAKNEDLQRSAEESGVATLRRLRFSRVEADAIASLVREEGRFEAVDFQASRATALSPELGEYRILHFATHGLVNSTHPELSGLVFSTVDQNGAQQDGLLRLHEIFNLSLKAELVVLSACQTALGREIRGEGLIGLTRGFMYAGAPRVVASLWNVEDRATAELMKRFYDGMLKRQLKPAAALHEAQLALARDKRWSSPYYWAGFILQGEWR